MGHGWARLGRVWGMVGKGEGRVWGMVTQHNHYKVAATPTIEVSYCRALIGSCFIV